MAKKATDLSGMRFGSLTVIEIERRAGHGRVYWQCRCDCGKEYEARCDNLLHGRTTRCIECSRRACAETKMAKPKKIQPESKKKPRPAVRGMCYNVLCTGRFNDKRTVWSCILSNHCPYRKTVRESDPKHLMRSCKECRYWDTFSAVCCNADSDFVADFTDDYFVCNKFEPKSKINHDTD